MWRVRVDDEANIFSRNLNNTSRITKIFRECWEPLCEFWTFFDNLDSISEIQHGTSLVKTHTFTVLSENLSNNCRIISPKPKKNAFMSYLWSLKDFARKSRKTSLEWLSDFHLKVLQNFTKKACEIHPEVLCPSSIGSTCYIWKSKFLGLHLEVLRVSLGHLEDFTLKLNM